MKNYRMKNVIPKRVLIRMNNKLDRDIEAAASSFRKWRIIYFMVVGASLAYLVVMMVLQGKISPFQNIGTALGFFASHFYRTVYVILPVAVLMLLKAKKLDRLQEDN